MNIGPYINGYDTTVEFSTNESTHEAEDAAGTPSWTEIEFVDAVTLPKLTVGKVDNHHLKTPDRTKTRRPGWKDPGDASLTVKQKKAQTASLYALVGVEKGFRVTLADGSIFKFNGFIMDHDPSVEKEGDNAVVYAIATSGLPVFIPAP